ncbi:hypothetical protein MGG_16218 [Pyricularia oryzae 70-15]|uniref:Uncharacterized protein n=2 Tax=Pyricularia oryzae TaxID=318829 RepID=G4MNG1_PYRO7|nr:uncharacterized protein MGG_16218 [Pyricularia oryzae 70-15]EHA57075.1 hypothetical protein MGG_16218 [Pyricularia oryzae 70-15]ELQ35867.1 hypothetical protein OOU_Y34scaffold00684g7 [Pyricularia oryzae Y34]
MSMYGPAHVLSGVGVDVFSLGDEVAGDYNSSELLTCYIRHYAVAVPPAPLGN